MTAKHSAPIRGLSRKGIDTVSPQKFAGRFGRMFEIKAADFGPDEQAWEENLKPLADAMVSSFDPPKDGPDGEESGIPALYTYLGQFIDHDLTFDPSSSFQKKKDPDALTDYRSPAFDLDNVYGRGPGDQPYMYQDDGVSFALGDPLRLGEPPGAHDLFRSLAGRALIGDPRNDENAIVSQLQGLFHRFHNRLMAAAPHTAEGFNQVRREVTRHYQYVVLNDFLPRIVSGSVLEQLQTRGRYDSNKLQFYKPDPKDPFMPVEFSGAAYRLGHSMVRPGYRLNDATLLPIFPVEFKKQPGFPEGLTGFRRMISDWGIDWGRFIDIGEPRRYDTDPADPNDKAKLISVFRKLQFAYRIDTSLVDPLALLPPSIASEKPRSLALRNLVRAAQLGLPSGQDVAAAMKLVPLKDTEILIGQAVDEKDQPSLQPISKIGGGRYDNKCPLWTYILAEAVQNKRSVEIPVLENVAKPGSVKINTPQLGPVGGRIVAEVFLGLMFADESSLLRAEPDWAPAMGRGYRLKDFVQFALG